MKTDIDANSELRSTIEDRPILITGGIGRIALAAACYLSERFPIILSDRVSEEVARASMREAGLKTSKTGYPAYRELDLTHFPSVVRAMEGIGAVVHLAVVPSIEFEDKEAKPSHYELNSWDDTVLRLNPLLTYHVFEASQRNGVARVINGSSLTVQMGDLNRAAFREEEPIDPLNIYACSKLAGESLAHFYSRQRGLPVYSLRIGQPYPVFNRLCDQWRTSRRARSIFITMGDIACGIEAALNTSEPPGVFNLVSESDNPRVDLSRSLQMGYFPRDKFTAEGIWHRDGLHEPWRLE